MKVSLIVCARAEGDSAALQRSVEDSIGVRVGTTSRQFSDIDMSISYESRYDVWCHEMVGMSSMAKGYNLGTLHADGDVVIYTHADVRLWAGRAVWDEMIRKLDDPKVGMVGVAGSAKLGADACWWVTGSACRGGVSHETDGVQYPSAFGPYGEALVMDGVLLAARRSTMFQLGPWREDLGWHFYDIDMTFRSHLAGLKNYVVPLPLLHMSVGNPGPEWVKSRTLFCQTHRMKLPRSIA